MFWWARLLTVVEGDRLRVSFRPFLIYRNLPASEIVSFQATEYSPYTGVWRLGLEVASGQGQGLQRLRRPRRAVHPVRR